MIAIQFGYAGMNIITKISLNRGMSHYVLVVYRHAFATAVVAPFAFIFERFIQQPPTLESHNKFFVPFQKKFFVLFMQLKASQINANALFQFHRKAQPRITFPIFMQIFILALLGLVP